MILSNNDWDIIIIGDNNISNKTLQDGYTRIYKVNDNTFYSQYAYIASRRFMQKVKTNNMSTINTYLYTPTFMTTMGNPSTTNEYMIGLTSNIITANSLHLSYEWSPVSIY